MMKTISFLFNRFPRDVGIPYKGTFYRRPVYSKEDFIYYINTVNGTSPGCYTSVYESTNDVIVDKAVFDLDSPNLQQGLEECKQLSSYLTSDKTPHIIFFSGRKGYHVYCLFEPLQLNRETSSYYLFSFHHKYSEGLKTVDSHLVGNVSAMIRVPNTLNNGHYCAFLPPDKLQDFTIQQILDWAKTPHRLLKPEGKLKRIDEIVSPSKRYVTKVENVSISLSKTIPTDDMISRIIRPCVFNLIHGKEPKHLIRVDFVSEMRFLGYNEEQILDICMKNFKDVWIDWDIEKTQYQINNIFKKNLKPLSYEKLRELGADCGRCELRESRNKCSWYYWW